MKLKQKYYWLSFSLFLLALIFLQYFGLAYYHYQVPPGHDAMMHWWIIKPFYDGKETFFRAWQNGSYPPLFHISTAYLAHLFNVDPMKIMLWATPSIIVFAALSIFLFSYFMFGPNVGLIAFFLYGFTGKIAIQQLNDGGFPDLIAAQIFLPLVLLFICLAVKNTKTKRIIYIFLSIIAAALTVATHHIATFYLLGITLVSLPIILIFNWIMHRWRILKGILWSIDLIILYVVIFYLYGHSVLFAPARGLANGMIQVQNSWPFYKIVGTVDPQAIVSLHTYPAYVGESIFIFGFLGIFATLIIYRKNLKKYFLPAILMIVWAVILLIGSRMSFLSNPDRLTRDSVIPLSVLAAILINYLIKSSWKINLYLGIATALIIVLITCVPLRSRIKEALAYEPMERVTNADVSAINYLNQQKPGSLYVEAYDFYLNYFLPKWQITYLWLPQTYQPPTIHPLNPNVPNELAALKTFDYIYIVDNQTGWVPAAIQFNFAHDYLSNSNFQLVDHQKSQTNEVYLFKVVK